LLVPTIDPAKPLATLITVHECLPENQGRLADLLLEAASSIYAGAPGFVSATIHRSIDGTRVTNYAQYENREAFERLRTNPAIPSFVERVRLLITRAEPHLYEVTGSVSGAVQGG
jgi:quinol monooxygenase YgiN